MEWRAQAALCEGRAYVPVTERGAVVHAALQTRAAFAKRPKRLGISDEPEREGDWEV